MVLSHLLPAVQDPCTERLMTSPMSVHILTSPRRGHPMPTRNRLDPMRNYEMIPLRPRKARSPSCAYHRGWWMRFKAEISDRRNCRRKIKCTRAKLWEDFPTMTIQGARTGLPIMWIPLEKPHGASVVRLRLHQFPCPGSCGACVCPEDLMPAELQDAFLSKANCMTTLGSVHAAAGSARVLISSPAAPT